MGFFNSLGKAFSEVIEPIDDEDTPSCDSPDVEKGEECTCRKDGHRTTKGSGHDDE